MNSTLLNNILNKNQAELITTTVLDIIVDSLKRVSSRGTVSLHQTLKLMKKMALCVFTRGQVKY